MVSVYSSLDSYNAGQEVTLTFSLDSGLTASSGAVEVSAPDGVSIVSGEWMIDNPTLKIFDKKTNKGAFSFDSERQTSGDVFRLTFKTNRELQTGMNVRIEFRGDSSTALNETVTINVDSTGQKILPTKEPSAETQTIPQGAVIDTEVREVEQDASTYAVTNEYGETVIIDANGDPVLLAETKEVTTTLEEGAQADSGNGPGLYIALGVILAVIIAAVIICFTRKKRIEKRNNTQEEKTND